MLSEPQPKALINETYQVLKKPLENITVSKSIPESFTAALNANTYYFSGVKIYRALKEASLSLKGENGNFKPFNQFLNDVLKLDNTYNKAYLQAEYNLAVSATQMAIKYKDFEADGDRYNLQYRTSGDERVREEHAALNGTTLPPSDPFWNSYMPPNGWNCRCTVTQVLKDKYPLSNSADAIALGDDMTKHPKLLMFRFNPGAQAKVFPDKHPYLPKENSPKDVKKAGEVIDRLALRQRAKDIIKWGKENVIGKLTYENESFGNRKATFVKNSFTENLQFGELFEAKIDVLKNIDSYLPAQNINLKWRDNNKKAEKPTVDGYHVHKTIYKGEVEVGKGREIELQFEDRGKDGIVFYFIKFI
jgi:SPP1 gp7 family putative phage head morphogenesis protein